MITTSPAIDLNGEFQRIVNELTRRGFLAGAAGTAALLGLSACDGNEDSNSSDAATPSTRRVQGAYGPVEVPAHPERVVALAKLVINTMLDLGINLVGVDDGEAAVAISQYKTTLAGLPTVGAYGEFDLEKIAALKPDLIVTYDSFIDRRLYDKLRDVAPTFAVASAKATTWQDGVADLATAVNRTDQLASLRERFDKTVRTTKQRHGSTLAGNRWEIVQNAAGTTGRFYRWLPSSDAGRVLAGLGATLGNAGASGSTSFGPQISDEQLVDQLGHATAILCVKNGSGPLVAQPLWRKLPAVRAGHVFFTDLLTSVAGYSAATDLVEAIAAACTTLEGTH